MPEIIPKACANPACANTTTGVQRYCDTCRGKRTRVYLITGPSGSGKTTLVRQRARPGDLVLDFDRLYQALSGLPLYDKPEPLLPFVLAARDRVIDLIGEVAGVPRAWIIRNRITASEQAALVQVLGAEVIELRVDADECKRRIDNDPHRPVAQRAAWHARIDEWYRDHA